MKMECPKCGRKLQDHSKKLIAERPLNTTLNIEKISKEIQMPTVNEIITSFSENYKAMVQNEVEASE